MARISKHGASLKPQTRNAVKKSVGRGASIRKKTASLNHSVGGLLGHHLDAAGNSLARLTGQPFAALMTLLVIGIALALPTGLHLLVQNARLISGEWANAVDLSVYVTPGTSEQALAALSEQVEAHPLVDGLIVLSAAEALEDFKALSGFGAALDTLEENPLPATLIVRPNALDENPEQVMALAAELQALPNVDLVQLDTEWVERFHAMLDVVRRVVMVAGVLLALAVLVIVGNTIRMEIQQRRDEIEITRLVGGSDAFIRRPFLYTGIWYGALGGLISVALVTVAVHLVGGPVSRVAGLYGSDFSLRGLADLQWLWLVLGAVVLGAVGSWIAASRHLRHLELA